MITTTVICHVTLMYNCSQCMKHLNDLSCKTLNKRVKIKILKSDLYANVNE